MGLQNKPRISTKQMVHRWNTYAKKDAKWIILTHPDKKDGQWDDAEFFATGRRDIGSVMDWLETESLEGPRDRALDFGCGIGRLTQALCEYFDRCDGVDISEQMVSQAREHNRFGDRCHYHVNESDRLEQFADESFSFVFTAIVLQHIHPEYSTRYMQEFARITQPGGLVVFQLPEEREGAPQTLPSDGPNPGGWKKGLGKLYYGFRGWWYEVRARLRSRLRFALGEMDVEMHSLPKSDVVSLMEAKGLKLILDKEDWEIANGWRSRWYVFRK